MTVEGLLVNPESLRSLYGEIPDLTVLRIRSINLNWRGPTVTLRVDLPSFPLHAPPEWTDRGVDTLQCQLQFLAVEGIALTEWAPPVIGRVDTTPYRERRRMRVTVRGRGISLEFDCSDSVRVSHPSAFKIQGDGSDEGPHIFVSKVDGRRYDSLPDTAEKTFYER